MAINAEKIVTWLCLIKNVLNNTKNNKLTLPLSISCYRPFNLISESECGFVVNLNLDLLIEYTLTMSDSTEEEGTWLDNEIQCMGAHALRLVLST